jgi:predicted RNA binding protein YcfA (HicA-like mRNA interferase family)
MKRTKLLKHLRQHGCTFDREGGNHTIYRNADRSRKTVIPRHTEIKPNMVRKICKDMDVPTPEEK